MNLGPVKVDAAILGSFESRSGSEECRSCRRRSDLAQPLPCHGEPTKRYPLQHSDAGELDGQCLDIQPKVDPGLGNGLRFPRRDRFTYRLAIRRRAQSLRCTNESPRDPNGILPECRSRLVVHGQGHKFGWSEASHERKVVLDKDDTKADSAQISHDPLEPNEL